MEMALALERGVNYFDTAYLYPGSEECLGRFLQEYGCRDQVFIATKLPQYRLSKAEQFDIFFNEELKRLRTNHIDYYLMHMLNDAQSWQRLCALGALEWVQEKKRNGQIRQIGFSFHGGTEQFKDPFSLNGININKLEILVADITHYRPPPLLEDSEIRGSYLASSRSPRITEMIDREV